MIFALLFVVAGPFDDHAPAHAQTVRTLFVAPTGSDSNPGTQLQPFATIQHAADVVNAGDTVIVEDGVYTGIGTGTACASSTERPIVCLARGGATGALVTFKARNPGGAKLDGQHNTSTSGFRFRSTASYVRIEGFEIYGLGSATNGVSGIQIYAGGHDSEVVGNNIHDIGKLCTDHVYGMNGIFVQQPRVMIQGNRIHDIGRFAAGENGCTPSTLNYQNHDHGVYVNGKDDGTASGASDVLVANNLIYNVLRGWSIQVYPDPVSRLSVLNNTFAFANPYRDGHIIFAASTSDGRVENNIFYSPRNAALNFNAGSHTNLQLTNNVIFNAALFNSQPSGALILSNDRVDPLLVNATTAPFDFHLSSGSPAINAGLTLIEVPVDYDGAARVDQAYDVGAYEFSGAPLPVAVATPTITPNGGVLTAPTAVALATATPGATINYTTDGTTPTSSSSVYNGPFTISSSATVRARAREIGMLDSSVAEATFQAVSDNVPPVVRFASPVEGAVVPRNNSLSFQVVATDNFGVASVRFALDGRIISTDTSAPYSASYNFKKASLGPHVVTAVASDTAGNTSSASITVWR